MFVAFFSSTSNPSSRLIWPSNHPSGGLSVGHINRVRLSSVAYLRIGAIFARTVGAKIDTNVIGPYYALRTLDVPRKACLELSSLGQINRLLVAGMKTLQQKPLEFHSSSCFYAGLGPAAWPLDINSSWRKRLAKDLQDWVQLNTQIP